MLHLHQFQEVKMGLYINPRNDQTKRDWLATYAKPLIPLHPVGDWQTMRDGGCVPVCCIDNGLFLALGVAYSAREAEEFCDPKDHRPHTWYRVAIHDLNEEAGISPEMLKKFGLAT